MRVVFVIIGILIGFLQYGLLKTFIRYMAEKKGAAGVAAIKLVLYGIIAAILLFWFKDMWGPCLLGVLAGYILTAITDFFRSRKK